MSEIDLFALGPDECTSHLGKHTRHPNLCPDCGKFSAHSWATEPHWGMDGMYVSWGGICKTHGAWSDSG